MWEEIRLVSINVDEITLDRTFNLEELYFDFFGDCNLVPSNDDVILLAELDGEDKTNIIERENEDVLIFNDVVKFLKWK